MLSSTPDHLILDLEGIAFDPLPSSTHAVRRALIRIAQPWPLDEDLDWIARVPVHEALRRLVDGDDEVQSRFLARVRHYYCNQRWGGVKGHDGVRAMLDRLRRDLGVGVTLVSAQPVATVRNQIEDLGFEGTYDSIACPEHGGCAQCRRRFATEMATRQRDPARIAWISDLPGDLMAARRVGLTPIAAAWGRSSADVLSRAAPHYLAYSPHKLIDGWQRLASAKAMLPAHEG